MTTVERGLRIAGGVLEAAGGVSGAGEEAATLGKAGRQTAETVEVLADTGTGVKVPVKVKVSTTTEAAIERAGAKPVQTAEELTLEARAAKAENTGTRRNVEMQEAAGGHTIERHVDKSENWLRNRIETDPTLKIDGVASSFRNETIANRVQGQFIKQNKEAILNWLKSGDNKPFVGVVEMNEPVGIVVERGKAGFVEANKARIVLFRNNSEHGWHIRTSFPVTK